MNTLQDRFKHIVLNLLPPYKVDRAMTCWELRKKIYDGDTGCSEDVWNLAMNCLDSVLDTEDCEITVGEMLE